MGTIRNAPALAMRTNILGTLIAFVHEEFIVNFNDHTSSNEQWLEFLVEIEKDYKVKVVVNVSRDNNEEYYIVDNRSRRLEIKVNDNCAKKAIARLLYYEILNRKSGVLSEEITRQIFLPRLRKEGEIVLFQKTTMVHDRAGADFFVIIYDKNRNRIRVPLQVKSSEEGFKKHSQKYPRVPCVVVNTNVTYEQFKAAFKNEVEKHITFYSTKSNK